MDEKGIRLKVTLLYIHVTAKGYPEAAPPEYYRWYEERFVKTYKKYQPGVEHDLRIISCGAMPDKGVEALYGDITAGYYCYLGAGSDIGAHQQVLQGIESDFVVCMSTPVYFWKRGWLKQLLDARNHFGDGLYGPFASYQNSPHIRTSCWAVTPATFRQYPDLIDTREKCCCAESFRNQSVHQISDWFESIGKPVLMVTWSGVFGKTAWRSPSNIYRRGDQTNCLVLDQHTDHYSASHYYERCLLEKMADIDENCPAIS